MADMRRPTSAGSPLSILMLTDFLYEDAPGGSRRVVKEVAEGLAARGHRVTIVVPRWTGDDAERDERGGVAVYRYGQGDRGLRALPALVSDGRRVLAELPRERGQPFDVLHAHFAYSHLPALLPASTAFARTTIRSFYGPWALEGFVEEGPSPAGNLGATAARWVRFNARELIERRSLARSNRIIALSDYSAAQLTGMYGVERALISFVPGGVDQWRFVPPILSTQDVRRRLGLPLDSPVVLTVRRLAARMGLDNLIAALPLAQRHLPIAPHLIIVGQGPLRQQLERQAAALGLGSHVHFVGFVDDADLPLYYQAADLFVLPTRSLEGFGLITLEAFASGLPVVGTPVGATPELLAQVDRRLILGGSEPDAIASGIVRYFSEVRGQVLSPRLRDLVLARYTWDIVVERTRDAYEKALDEAAQLAQ